MLDRISCHLVSAADESPAFYYLSQRPRMHFIPVRCIDVVHEVDLNYLFTVDALMSTYCVFLEDDRAAVDLAHSARGRV
jgi:hypothetical protein